MPLVADRHTDAMSAASEDTGQRWSGFAGLLPRGGLTRSLYGLVLVSSVLAVSYKGKDVEQIGAGLLVTAAVFALAHAWAQALEAAAVHRVPVDRRAFARSLSHEWPMVTAAVPSAVAVGLAAVGVYSLEVGLWVATGVNVLLLFVWGAGVREIAGGSLAEVLRAGVSTAALGLLLVGLKVLVH